MAKSAVGGGSNPPAKQKNLFSFFSKKASSSPPASSKSTPASSAKSSSSKTDAEANAAPSAPAAVRKGGARPTPSQLKLLSQITVGTRLAVHWPDDDEYYPCVVHAHRHDPKLGEGGGHTYEIHYDDGEVETVDLATERFKVIGGKKRKQSKAGEKDDSKAGSIGNDAKKRRRIMEDSDEDEFDEDMESSEDEEADDSGSEYKGGDVDEDDESLDADAVAEEEDDWMGSEDEEEEEKPKRKVVRKAAPKVTVTRVGGSGGREITPTPTNNSARKAAPKRDPTTDMDFSADTPSTFGSKPPTGIKSSAKASMKNNALSQPSPMPSRKLDARFAAAPARPAGPIPKPVAGAVNPAGSHMHNHLKFFTTNRKDAEGRSPTHPDYSSRSLLVNWNELAKAQDNNKISPAQRQWWEIKSQYADTVLLFKTGKFYEMFHDDADVGVSVLGHQYMKGTPAHSGFPEAIYGKIVGQLVKAGYTVARVEQTETPADLKERKRRMPKGQKKPEVVCREVCSVTSKGTRTFCYLDDISALEEGNPGRTSTGPLLAIKEIPAPSGEDGGDAIEEDGEAGTKAVYEYGVTIVDAVTGVVTLGQFADDVLRSRMQTLVASFGPSEVLYEGGQDGVSKTLLGFLKSACPPSTNLTCIAPKERPTKSTAVDANVRRALDREGREVQPWDVEETVKELHRRAYYPRSSRTEEGVGRWPEILRRCVEGGATLALSSFGAALYYLQRSLVDSEILSMGIVKAYVPPNTSMKVSETAGGNSSTDGEAGASSDQLQEAYAQEARKEAGVHLAEDQQEQLTTLNTANDPAAQTAYAAEANIDHMALDGTTLSNLEILHNIATGSHQGSLLSKIDATMSPHGSRLLRAWLLRPLFVKTEIDRRADAVEELAGGSAAASMSDARDLLKRTGDIERLLSRVHSMGRGASSGNDANASAHPNQRAILYEADKHNKRKVGDFSKLLNGLRAAADIPELFDNADIRSPMLQKIVRTTDEGGCFPSGMKERLDWFFDNFDLAKAARGEFEPSPGMDEEYDGACDAMKEIKQRLDAFKDEMCASGELQPRNHARSAWNYVNLREDSKDKYLIELPASINVPGSFIIKGKRGKGTKQVNKYRTPEVEEMVVELEHAIDIKSRCKADGMARVFAKFDSMRHTWMAAVNATAMLDAIGSMAQIAVQPGFTRPVIVDCPPTAKPGIEVVQGRHPCVDITHSGGDFIPNDLALGGRFDLTTGTHDLSEQGQSSVLLLSGPNMGGKSTLLRQTCLITILAQMGSYVPAESCALTPVDRIFTRLGASDRILCGQSTFFVELAETSAAVRGATRRSLVIMDELGRGTSTFDGTSIASATVKHLVEMNRCLTLFATHYHSLLEDWKNEPSIKLGHMECIVEDDDEADSERKNDITFLYTLGDGPCPRSFGVNVARLAGLPDAILQRAKKVSASFEAEMNGEANRHKIIPATAEKLVGDVSKLLSEENVDVTELKRIWSSLH